MMQLSLNSKLSIFLAITVIAIIGSPFVYAAVEPHIEINMDAAQTTAPFTIKDNGGSTVFEIAPDGSGAGYSEGTEIMLLDESGFTGTSSAFGWDGAMSEFTMPTASDFYIITAIEVRTGTTASTGTVICAGVFRPQIGVVPIADGNWFTAGQVAMAHNNSTVGGGGYDTATNTVYKMPAVSSIVYGGETLIVSWDACINSSTQFDGAARTKTISDNGQTNLGTTSNPGLGNMGSHQGQTGTNNFYVVVYGKAL